MTDSVNSLAVTNISHFSNELLFQILANLDYKSLIRFSTTSKQFHELVKSYIQDILFKRANLILGVINNLDSYIVETITGHENTIFNIKAIIPHVTIFAEHMKKFNERVEASEDGIDSAYSEINKIANHNLIKYTAKSKKYIVIMCIVFLVLSLAMLLYWGINDYKNANVFYSGCALFASSILSCLVPYVCLNSILRFFCQKSYISATETIQKRISDKLAKNESYTTFKELYLNRVAFFNKYQEIAENKNSLPSLNENLKDFLELMYVLLVSLAPSCKSTLSMMFEYYTNKLEDNNTLTFTMPNLL